MASNANSEDLNIFTETSQHNNINLARMLLATLESGRSGQSVLNIINGIIRSNTYHGPRSSEVIFDQMISFLSHFSNSTQLKNCLNDSTTCSTSSDCTNIQKSRSSKDNFRSHFPPKQAVSFISNLKHLTQQNSHQNFDPKPNFSYIGLIAKAILSTEDKRMVLADIYQWIQSHYPYFRARGPGWRNSIRHNLSLNDCFIKFGRSANGKGHYWGIHPANISDFLRGDFRRRRAQRKVRRAMGISCITDDNDSDSPSCPTPPPFPPGRIDPAENNEIFRIQPISCHLTNSRLSKLFAKIVKSPNEKSKELNGLKPFSMVDLQLTENLAKEFRQQKSHLRTDFSVASLLKTSVKNLANREKFPKESTNRNENLTTDFNSSTDTATSSEFSAQPSFIIESNFDNFSPNSANTGNSSQEFHSSADDTVNAE